MLAGIEAPFIQGDIVTFASGFFMRVIFARDNCAYYYGVAIWAALRLVVPCTVVSTLLVTQPLPAVFIIFLETDNMINQTKIEIPYKSDNLGSFKVNKAFVHLFEKSIPYLTERDLEYLVCAKDWVYEETENMGKILSSLGYAVSSDDSGFFDIAKTEFMLMLGEHYLQLHALLRVASESGFFLKNPTEPIKVREMINKQNEIQIQSDVEI